MERRIWLDRDAANAGIELLQLSRSADKRTAGAEHGDKMSDAALGLLPNFLRRRAVMRPPTRLIAVLVGLRSTYANPPRQAPELYEWRRPTLRQRR